MKYAIFAGLNGGFGGATFQYVDDFDSEDVRNGLRESFGEEPGEEDVRERYIEEVENWIDYRVEEYEEGKDYEQ